MILKPSWLQVRHSSTFKRCKPCIFIWDGCWKGLPREDWSDVLWNNIITSWHWDVKRSVAYLQFMGFWLILFKRQTPSSAWGKLLSKLPTLAMLIGPVEGVQQVKRNFLRMRKASLSHVQFIGLVESITAMTHSPKIATWLLLFSLIQCWVVGPILKLQTSHALLVLLAE